MYERIRFTEYLDLDLNDENWYCHDCGTKLISARQNYKRGCMVAQRMPEEIHNPVIDGPYSFAPDANWVRIVEFYCPNCSRQIETEYLPPGHPITVDIEVDIDSLKARLEKGEITVTGGKLVKVQTENRA